MDLFESLDGFDGDGDAFDCGDDSDNVGEIEGGTWGVEVATAVEAERFGRLVEAFSCNPLNSVAIALFIEGGGREEDNWGRPRVTSAISTSRDGGRIFETGCCLVVLRLGVIMLEVGVAVFKVGVRFEAEGGAEIFFTSNGAERVVGAREGVEVGGINCCSNFLIRFSAIVSFNRKRISTSLREFFNSISFLRSFSSNCVVSWVIWSWSDSVCASNVPPFALRLSMDV